jgi:pentatricopeptide repeat protein
MQSEGTSPDILTFVCVLKACGNIGCLEIGEEIHAEVRKLGLLRNNTVLGNALIDMYSKCGVLEKARVLFEELPVQDTVSWNALISGYIRHGFCDEVIRCFRKMQTKGISPDPVTFIYILKACGTVGCVEMGESIHTQLRNRGFLGKDHVQLDTALVDMYGKCGMPEKAQEVFQELCRHDIIGWNALISGYSQVGKVRKVLGSFREMSAEGIPTDRVTSLVLLSTCSHEGLMKEGKILFGEMCSVYDLDAMLDHCACMLDLLGRAGCFHEAAHMLEKMPSSNHLPLLLSILGACKTWANVNLGEWAFLRILDLDPVRSEAYVCMGNIYAAAGMQIEVGGQNLKAEKCKTKHITENVVELT